MDTGAILDMFYPHAQCRCDLALKMIYPVVCRGWHLSFFGGMNQRRPRVPFESASLDRLLRTYPLRHDVMHATRFPESLKLLMGRLLPNVDPKNRLPVSDQRSRSLGTVIQGC